MQLVSLLTCSSGRQPEYCVTFWLLEGIKIPGFGDLWNIFEFCKMFWKANDVFDPVTYKNRSHL